MPEDNPIAEKPAGPPKEGILASAKKAGMGIAAIVIGLLSLKGAHSIIGRDVQNSDIVDKLGMPPVLVVEKFFGEEYLVKVSRRKYVPLGEYLGSLDMRERYVMQAKIEAAIMEYNSQKSSQRQRK